MEAAFVAWVVDRCKKNVVLDAKTITAKALSLYDTFTEKAIGDNHGESTLKNLSILLATVLIA